MQNISQKAIECALSQDWVQAINVNEEILKENNQDIDALNRLAYALSRIGKIEKAKKIYRKTISLDRYNYIALKNLEKISSLPKSAKTVPPARKENLTPSLFLEEPGKTKTVGLINVAPASTLSKIDIGDTVFLYPKKHSIEVRQENKTYLGALPDDVSFRLLKFIKAGNEYYACIKNIQKKSVSIFIREIKRGKRYLNQPTFITLTHDWSAATSRELKKNFQNDTEEEGGDQEDLDEE